MKKITLITMFILCFTMLTGCIRFVSAVDDMIIADNSIPLEVTAVDFDISSLKLKILTANNEEKTVPVTEDMLVSPSLDDLKTPGEKTIIIKFRDVEYTFKVVLLDKYPNVKVNFYIGDTIESTKEVTKYSAIGTLATAPSKEGFDFKGWYLDEIFGLKALETTEVNNETNLYACYTSKMNKVTFDFNVPSSAATELYKNDYIQNVASGNKAVNVYPEKLPILDGYTFGGWYKDSNCQEVYDFNSVVLNSFTIYAKWTVK